MTDLAAWLLEQIAEDHATSAMASPVDAPGKHYGCIPYGDALLLIASPTRVLAECDAKLRIVTLCRFWIEHNPHLSPEFIAGSRELAEETLSALALPYADRPGYLEEWRP